MDSFIYTTPDKDVVVTLLLKTLTHLHPYLRTRRTKRITRDGLAREFRLLPLVKAHIGSTSKFMKILSITNTLFVKHVSRQKLRRAEYASGR